jgi:membrane-bound lytic murein transglycosylase A
MIAACVRTGVLVWALSVSCAGAGLAQTVTLLDFADLDGWAADDHAAALAVFRNTCGDMPDPDWGTLCALAAEGHDPRIFFEMFFRPVLLEDGQEMLFTGYFEPQLRGALAPDDVFRFPIYALPTDIPADQPWPTRAEIEDGALSGKGLEIAWVDDPVDLFFLQVQGSGRISLPDGRVIRVGYAGANGWPYTSIGQELVRRGVYTADQVSAQVIRSWVARNPELGPALLRVNQSYVFFREVSEVPADLGPLGAMNRSVTTMRTIAVDPAFTPLGAPVWIEKDGAEPLRRLMVAQDTGSAIKGAQRADIFFGTGMAAGVRAGRIKDGGRMVVLLPIQRAYSMLPDVLAGDH